MLAGDVFYFLCNDIETGKRRNAERRHDTSSGERRGDDNGGRDDEERDEERDDEGDNGWRWLRRDEKAGSGGTRGQQAAQTMRITHRQEGPKGGLGTVGKVTPSGQCCSA